MHGTSLLSLAILAIQPADAIPEKYIVKVAEMPDFCQGDERFGRLPTGGDTICGPVAVSNALMWLHGNGFPELLPVRRPAPRDQAALIGLLASDQYMNVSADSGTAPKQFVAGLERFATDRGYQAKIETMGWRSSAKRIAAKPDVAWMQKSAIGDWNLVLNIGWYVYQKDQNVYQRTNGHYVTVAGFERRGQDAGLYVHDPAVRDGLEKRTVTCRLRPLPKEATLRLQSGGSTSADGFFELHGVQIKRGNDLAIIDQAIAFTLLRRP
jgi:hypothetical protein